MTQNTPQIDTELEALRAKSVALLQELVELLARIELIGLQKSSEVNSENDFGS